MKKITYFSMPLVIGGLFLFADRWLKWNSTHEWFNDKLINKFLGWYPSYNVGVVFGLPLPNIITIFLTLPIILLVLYLLYKNFYYIISNISLSFVLLGALSNFWDRLLYGKVIDYFLLFTLVINIADIMIVGGLLIYLFYEIKYKNFA